MEASKYLFWTILMVGAIVIFTLLVLPHFNVNFTVNYQ